MSKQLKNLKRTQYVADNVCCGLVNWKGEQLYGCGAKPIPAGFRQYMYEDDKVKVFSTVYLCPKCELKLETENE